MANWPPFIFECKKYLSVAFLLDSCSSFFSLASCMWWTSTRGGMSIVHVQVSRRNTSSTRAHPNYLLLI